MSTFWTEEDRKEASRLGVSILFSNTSPEALKPQLRELPSDVHLVKYEIEVEHDGMTGMKVQYDAVRAYKRVDIFDCYYARLKAYNGRMLHISVAGGYVKPKLWTGLSGE